MRRATGWLVRWGPVLAVCLVALLVAADAGARVGGGQNFSTGGSSGGGYSGGGSSGGDGELLFLLIWLIIEYPAIGIPVAVVVGAFFVVRFMANRDGERMVSRTHHHDGTEAVASPPRRAGPVPGLDTLRAADPGFSEPVLRDYIQLLHRRATEAAVTRAWEPLLPFVDVAAREALETAHRGVTEVRDVTLGGLQLIRVDRQGDRFRLQARLQDTRRETLEDGSTRFVYVEESWTLDRAADAESQAPEAVLRMGCPSCGAAIDTDRQGRCRSCGTPIVTGLLQWTATRVSLAARRAVEPPQVGWTTGGDEPSVHVPTIVAPDLPQAWRAFRGRHPGFDPHAFQARSRDIFLDLQRAWSEGRWETARPHVTDTLYQTLRFYLEQYSEHGLRNRVADVEILKQEIVRVQQDAWYEAITVRITARARDWVERTDGEVVGGNAKIPRRFSEYWTYLRAIGSGDTSSDGQHCPSCGAPLDRVSQAGVCGYCDSKITTGRFDWVLSRIDQPQVYRG
jgi:predicted lipid-binding transport protein (Tim44 family)